MSLPTTLPSTIGRFALLIHEHRGARLEIDSEDIAKLGDYQEPEGIYSIREGVLSFSSLEAKNQYVAQHVYSELILSSEMPIGERLFQRAYELWRHEIGHEDSASGRFMAIATTRINVLAVAAELIETGRMGVFDVLHIVESSLKYLPEIAVPDLVAVIKAQHPKTENDMARGMIFSAIEDALKSRPKLAWQVYDDLKESPSETTVNLLVAAVMSIAATGEVNAAVDCALAAANSENVSLAKSALWILARLVRQYTLTDGGLKSCIQTLQEKSDNQNEDIQWSAAQAISHAAVKETELVSDLLRLAQTRKQKLLYVLANHLFLNNKEATNYEALPLLLEALAYVSPDMTRTLNDVDYFLAHLFKVTGKEDLVIRTLTAWVINSSADSITNKENRENIESFDQTIMGLTEKPDYLKRLLTEWFSAEDQRLAASCAGVVSFLWVRGFRSPEFSSATLDEMDAPSLVHLMRRMLGYVYSEDGQLSFTFSLLNTRDSNTRTYQLVHHVLTEQVGRNYVESTLRTIEKGLESASGELQRMLESAHKNIKNYMEALERLPHLQELRPPLQLRRALALKRQEDMRVTMSAADEKSVFRQLVTSVHVKAGTGWFSVNKDQVGEATGFQSTSHQVALPRKLLIDPVGYEIESLMFRLAKRGEE
jgi:hypothetical protein